MQGARFSGAPDFRGRAVAGGNCLRVSTWTGQGINTVNMEMGRKMNRFVELRDGTRVPALGLGTWYLGEKKECEDEERASLLAGLERGMRLIDTAEMYGEGLSEELVGRTIKGMPRDSLFLVSKVYPHNAGRRSIFHSCENSLRRMGTDYLDLYLLHWRGAVPLRETVECMEELKSRGKIRRWGVSNFDMEDMKELWSVPGGKNCMLNQVLYHLGSRGIEYELLPWMREHDVALMAYCPIAQGGRLSPGLRLNPQLKKIADKHNAGVEQIMLAFAIRDGHSIAIPRSGSREHTILNAKAGDIILTEEDIRSLDNEFPAPGRRTPLDIQ